MSKNHKHDMGSVLDALDNSDGDVGSPPGDSDETTGRLLQQPQALGKEGL